MALSRKRAVVNSGHYPFGSIIGPRANWFLHPSGSILAPQARGCPLGSMAGPVPRRIAPEECSRARQSRSVTSSTTKTETTKGMRRIWIESIGFLLEKEQWHDDVFLSVNHTSALVNLLQSNGIT